MTAVPSSTFAALKAGLDVRSAGRIVAAAPPAPIPTGISGLDQALGGGFPRGTLAVIEGPVSSGRTAILASLLAQTTHANLAAAIEEPLAPAERTSLYPPDLERAGVRLERMLFTNARSPLEIARCADILLRSRAFALVAMPAARLRGTVWSRLCGLAQKSDALLVVLAACAGMELAYFASTRVRCALGCVQWAGESRVLRELVGYEVNAHVVKHRRATPGAIARLQMEKAVNE